MVEITNPHRSQSSARSPVRSLQPFLGLSDFNSLQSELKQSLEEEEEEEAEAIETSKPQPQPWMMWSESLKWLVRPDL